MKLSIKLPKTFDWLLYLLPIILLAAGIAIIYSLTYYNNKISLTYNQIIYASIGIILMVIFTFIDYRNFKALGIYLYIIGVILLILVLFLGKTTFGATRWLDLNIFQLQPAEIFKFFLVVILAKVLSDRIRNIKIKDLILVAIIVAVPGYLVLKQPDLGTLMVLLVTTLSMLLICKLERKYLLIIGVTILVSIFASWFLMHDYQRQRIMTFLHPQSDPFGAGYNVRQAIISVGSGGLFGRGLGHGPQSQLNFLPVAHTDFIFAGLAEATGFVGSLIFILIFLFLISRIIGVARISKDNFGMLLAFGLATTILFQGVINISMNLGLVPVTGIPLPFVSSGGTALITNFIMIGILQSIYLRHKKITF